MSLTSQAAHGLLAEFDSADALIAAVKRTKDAGYSALEAFSPYPLEEAAEALGHHKSAAGLLGLTGGIIGGLAAFALEYYVAVIAYPINVGGRPENSWPVFIPITFELTVLTSAVAIFVGTLILCGFPRFHHELFAIESFHRSNSDRFFLCIKASDLKYQPTETRAFLLTLQALSVAEVPT